ncbi:MAG: IS3 family transposase [Marinobacter sp.]|nr:IS3 family transposase [Marinobacter sp.]MCL1484768.1 IS3 family transposase [Marinobacter sp.]
MTTVLHQRPASLPLSLACRALGLNRSTVYARHKATQSNQQPRTSRKHCRQPRALSEKERGEVRQTLYSEEFRDQPPFEVFSELLEQGRYLCSESTMYRLLRADGSQGDRRKQRPAQSHAIPRLVATRPNEVWSWDITKLPLQKRGVYLSAYVVIDLFSRFILAWMISRKENSALAQQLMDEALSRYQVASGQLTIHQDRGSPMIAHSYLDLLGERGVTGSHSRPRVSNDNPFSESQFKTTKYQPDYPGRFESVSHARQWFESYVDWYNFEHHHSGLAGFTPEQVFTGRYQELAVTRQQALDRWYQANPERFVCGRPVAHMPPTSVAINPISSEEAKLGVPSAVNFPTLARAKHTARETTLILE